MAKTRSPILDFAAYAVLRLATAFMQTLTDRAALAFASALAWLGYQVDHRHREVADENLRHAFPELDAKERDRIIRGCFHHFTTLIVEIARLQRKLHVLSWRRHVNLIGAKGIVRVLTSGRSAMIVTAHLGNWELAGFAIGLFGFRTHAIARPLDNPYVDGFMRKFREATGQRVLAKKGDFDQITDLMKSGGILATLADQDAGERGLFVDFFNRPASTHKAIALMSIEYDVPLIVVGTVRVASPMRYNVIVEEVIEPSDYADRPDAVKAITQRYTSAIERLIRRHPEQYFWLHRRWKHQPVARKAKRAA
jgi:Kdo2-lipid IVA lauroyltransferase/acyltransferase